MPTEIPAYKVSYQDEHGDFHSPSFETEEEAYKFKSYIEGYRICTCIYVEYTWIED